MKTTSRITQDFNFDWKFSRAETDFADAYTIDFDDTAWQDVRLPHDWSVEASFTQENTGGSGLGLAPARDIIRSHGGDIELRNRPQGGLNAIVRLPIL